MMRSRASAALVFGVAGLLAGGADAGGAHRHGAPPSRDAADLAALAPPAPASTVAQSYGDAAFARRRFGGAVWRPCVGTFPGWGAGPGAGPCAGRTTEDLAGGGRPDRGYASTPAYLSAPQILVAPPGAETRLLPQPTVLPWFVDSLLNRR